MQQDQGTTSLWYETTPASRSYPTPPKELAVDVCVVGGGITGLSVAYCAAREGLSVAVLEAAALGSGETGRTTAHLACALDDRFQHIERVHGERGMRLAAESHARAIDTIEEITKREQIDCDFRRLDGYLFLGGGDSVGFLKAEKEAAHRAGLTDAELLDGAGPDVGFNIGPCLRFPRQGQFHPLKYLNGLADAIERLHGRIFCNASVKEFNGGPDASVKTADGATVKARWIVVATNSPVNDRVVIHTKQAPYRTYAIGVRVPMRSVAPALYWDTADPYHYVRLQRGNDNADVLIVGGEDHKTGQEAHTDDRFARLERWARERFPFMGDVAFAWSGQVFEPVDGVAFIGRNPMDDGNVFIATGDSGMGMTHGTIAGLLITDLIMGRENPWAPLYDPARKSLRSVWEFTKENANVAVQYLDWLTGSDVSSADEIKPESGAVMRRGLTKVALYRDAHGTLHELSAVCPHLQGIVHWNPTERSWDCPCHGSRFKPNGEVICGPALGGMKPAKS